MPDVVGQLLPDVGDTLGEAGFHKVTPRDDITDERSIIIDSNWTVVRQVPAAGTATAKCETVSLYVLKTIELAETTSPTPSPTATQTAARPRWRPCRCRQGQLPPRGDPDYALSRDPDGDGLVYETG